jgi:hypothetical protein
MQNGQRGLASTLVFCSLIAAISAMQARSANAAADCLSAPKDSTPQGKHWYYRVERQTKRACWYLGEEGRSTSRNSNRAAAAQTQSEAAAPDKTATQQNNKEPLQPAVANARAELSKDVAVPFMTMPPIAPQPSTIATPRENPVLQTNEPAPPDNSRFTERWPDTQTSTRVAQADVAAPPVPVPAQAQPIAIPQQAAVPIAPTTAMAASDDSSDMLRIILAVLTATIALAAIVGRLILTHMRPRKRPAPRRPIWQTMVNENADQIHARASHSALRARAEADVEELLRALRYPEPPRVTLPIASANRGRRPTDQSGARA